MPPSRKKPGATRPRRQAAATRGKPRPPRRRPAVEEATPATVVAPSAEVPAPEREVATREGEPAEVAEPEREVATQEGEPAEVAEPAAEELEELDGEESPAAPKPRRAERAERSERSIARADPMAAYMAEVQRHPLLTREEEGALARKYRDTGDLDAAAQLVSANLRLVVKLAHEYHRNPLALLDLVQEGNIGLMQAVKKFDPERGVKLSTYAAWWIRAYILRYIMDNWKMVKLGTTEAQRKLFFKLRQEQDRLLKQGFEATPQAAGRAAQRHRAGRGGDGPAPRTGRGVHRRAGGGRRRQAPAGSACCPAAGSPPPTSRWATRS